MSCLSSLCRLGENNEVSALCDIANASCGDSSAGCKEDYDYTLKGVCTVLPQEAQAYQERNRAAPKLCAWDSACLGLWLMALPWITHQLIGRDKAQAAPGGVGDK